MKNIKEVIGLERLYKLNNLRLHLSFNELVDTSGLGDFESLEALLFKENKIVDIKGLEKLTTLKDLTLSYNKISEIKG